MHTGGNGGDNDANPVDNNYNAAAGSVNQAREDQGQYDVDTGGWFSDGDDDPYEIREHDLVNGQMGTGVTEESALQIVSRGIGMTGGLLQIYTSAKLIIGGGLFGKILGVGMGAHGVNNVYENYTGKRGKLRDVYETLFGESKKTYAAADVTMSALALTVTVKERMVVSGAVTTFEKVRSYQTMSQGALGFEVVNNLLTVGSATDD